MHGPPGCSGSVRDHLRVLLTGCLCLCFFINPQSGRRKFVISKYASEEKKLYIGDDLYNASRADVFLPTQKGMIGCLRLVFRSVGHKKALVIG